MEFSDILKQGQAAAQDRATAIRAEAESALEEARQQAREIIKHGETMERVKPYIDAFQVVTDLDDEWKDRGSGAILSATFYRPLPSPGYLVIGHYGWPSYGGAKGGVLALRADGPVPWKYPVDYKKVWDDSGSGANWDGSFWKAEAPPGYAAVGMLVQRGYKKPRLHEMVCVREDFVEIYDPEILIWNDKKSGSDDNVSVWLIGRTGTFFAHKSHKNPGAVAATLAEHALWPVEGKQPGRPLFDTIDYAEKYDVIGSIASGADVVRPALTKDRISLGDCLFMRKGALSRPNLPHLRRDGILPWKHPEDYKLIALADGWFAWKPVPPDGYGAAGALLSRSADKPARTAIACIAEDFLETVKPDTSAGKIGAFEFCTDAEWGLFAIVSGKKTPSACARVTAAGLLLSEPPRAVPRISRPPAFPGRS